MILVSRSRKKIIGLDGYGIKITKQEIIKWKKELRFVLYVPNITIRQNY
jgi:hypothetical protein